MSAAGRHTHKHTHVYHPPTHTYHPPHTNNERYRETNVPAFPILAGLEKTLHMYLKNGMVINAGEIKAQVDAFQPCICQVVCRPLVDVPLCLWEWELEEGGRGHSRVTIQPLQQLIMNQNFTDFSVIRETIHFVDEHLKLYVLVDLVGSCHSLVESNQGFPVVVLGNWVEGGTI